MVLFSIDYGLFCDDAKGFITLTGSSPEVMPDSEHDEIVLQTLENLFWDTLSVFIAKDGVLCLGFKGLDIRDTFIPYIP